MTLLKRGEIKFFVQEFVDGRWFQVRSFDTEAEAESFARVLGRKTRIVRGEGWK